MERAEQEYRVIYVFKLDGDTSWLIEEVVISFALFLKISYSVQRKISTVTLESHISWYENFNKVLETI